MSPLTLLLMVLLLLSLLLLLALCLTDPNASQTSSEEKLNQEAQQLEKRLSLLSHRCSTGRPQNTLRPVAPTDRSTHPIIILLHPVVLNGTF